MVTFNCEVCNDTVPKKNTEKHYYRCPQAYYTCIDCNVTFDDGMGYKKHTECISEDQKYQKALYKGKKKPQGKPAQAEVKSEVQIVKTEKAQPVQNKAQKEKVEKAKPQKSPKKSLLADKKGSSLYKILKSVQDKDEKKALLKKLVVDANGHLVLQE